MRALSVRVLVTTVVTGAHAERTFKLPDYNGRLD